VFTTPLSANSKKKYNFGGLIELTKAKVLRFNQDQYPDFKSMFQLLDREDTSFSILASTPEECDSWVKDIEENISSLNEHADLAAETITANIQNRKKSLKMTKAASQSEFKTAKQSEKENDWRELFKLPENEPFLQWYNCALKKGILQQGHLYIFQNYLCFNATITNTQITFAISEIAKVEKKSSLIFPNTIDIILLASSPKANKKYTFTSFLSRDEAFQTVSDLLSKNKLTKDLLLEISKENKENKEDKDPIPSLSKTNSITTSDYDDPSDDETPTQGEIK